MKAKELFKKKAEVATALDELGIDYPKIKSGASAGNPTQNFKELCELYDSYGEEEKPETVDPIVNIPVVNKLAKSMRFR